MGAILAVVGEEGDPQLQSRLLEMAGRSHAPGVPAIHLEDNFALAVQSFGWDASLASTDTVLAAFHGYLGNWDELSRGLDWGRAPTPSAAAKIAVAYEAQGDRLFPRLRGEFALILYDRRHRHLVAARDVVGSRPLYFRQHGGRSYIASEIRQVLAGSATAPEPDEDRLLQYLLNLPLVEEETICRGVKRVMPAHSALFSVTCPEEAPRQRRYWHPPEERTGRLNFREMAGELREVIERAVARAVPERPFALALSGGLDSTILWGLICGRLPSSDGTRGPGKPYSLVYPGMTCDEREFIELMWRRTGTSGRLIDGGGQSPLDRYPEMFDRIDTPFPPNLHQLDPLFDAMREDGRRILITGLGPDDWLSGNFDYLSDQLYRGRPHQFVKDILTLDLPGTAARGRLLGRQLCRTAGRFLPALRRPYRPPAWLDRSRAAGAESLWERINAATAAPSLARGALLRALHYQWSGQLYEPLSQYAASGGMELRHPLNDPDIIELAFALPQRALIAGRGRKHLLRLAAGDLLPETIRRNRENILFDCLYQAPARALAESVDYTCWHLIIHGILDQTGLNALFRSIVKPSLSPGVLAPVMRVHLAEIFLRMTEENRVGRSRLDLHR